MAVGNESVAAVVVTHNRRQLLRHCLSNLCAQKYPLDEIIVVDNASDDGTAELVSCEFPGISYVKLCVNIGAAGGVAAGMEAAMRRTHDWFWILDDDTLPAPEALGELLAYKDCLARRVRPPHWISGGGHVTFWRGRPVPVKQLPQGVSQNRHMSVDCADLNRSIVSRELVAAIGYPRADFFMMLWNHEYSLRAKRAGFEIWMVPGHVSHLNAGSSQGNSAPWRGYYQTRNHLTMVLQRGSSVELFWWAVRQAKFIAGGLLYSDRKWDRTYLRLLGAWHGFRRRMGRTIDPADYGPRANQS